MEPSLRIPGKIHHLYDADTPTVEFHFKINVRLLKGNCDELRDKDPVKRESALAAKREAYRICYEQKEDGQWAEPKNCIVEIPLNSDNISDLFTLGRVLGNVEIDGLDLMQHLLDNNFAQPRIGKHK